MAHIYQSIAELTGNTPLLRLSRIERQYGLDAVLLAKLEFYNPSGSIKDRAANAMLDDAEKRGVLKPGSMVIEPTSGNTGIGLAAACAARGYALTIVMPETMSVERRLLMAAYGAKLVLTDGTKGMRGAIEKAEELASQTPDSFLPGQFVNPANPDIHRHTTGPEIWRDTDGAVDILVSGVGTGGTVTGTGEYLKTRKPGLHVAAVEPKSSAVLSTGVSGSHKIQGIGAGFVPETLNTAVYDEVLAVEDADAFETARMLARTEGVLAGISSGAALWAALQLAKRPESRGKTIVVILPDTGERYLSSGVFAE